MSPLIIKKEVNVINTRKIKLLIDLLDEYLEFGNVYGYEIINITTYANGIIVSVSEISPLGTKYEPYLIVVELKDGKLAFKNTDLCDCIYDYLEEYDRSKEEADDFMNHCYQMIEDVLG